MLINQPDRSHSFFMARSKALINAVMPVYFVWYKKSHISNGTGNSVGSHSVSNTRSSGISVEDCDQTEILVTGFESSSGPGTLHTLPRPVDASNPVTSILDHEIQQIKMPLWVAARRSFFSF
jgi:hypothetical protein